MVKALNVNSKIKSILLIAGLTFLFLFGAIIALKIAKGFMTGSFFKKNLNLNDNSNVQLLKKLDDEWEFPEDYVKEHLELNGMDMYWVYQKGSSSDKVILQLHGGAYMRSLDDNGIRYERSAVKYAQISGAHILTIDYRVAPENPYPAALEDAVSAYQWLLDEGYKADNIIIAGDSAGGGLTLATGLYLRDSKEPMPAALITMSAWTNLDYKRVNIPYVGSNDPTDPYISPINGDYTGFPTMLMQAGTAEGLLSDTTEVAKLAKAAGVSVTQTSYDNMPHVFQLLYPAVDEANAAWDEIENFIRDKVFTN